MNSVQQNSNQTGFTLIELMISLVLGLLITAAAVQIYIINVKTATVQKSGSELQDASVFGLQSVESHIRLANLGNPTEKITDTLLDGGIVLTGLNIGVIKIESGERKDDYVQKASFLTRSEGDAKGTGNAWTGISNTNIDSDQLTIQYQNKTGVEMSDCEGSNVAVGHRVIERYFLRQATNDSSTGDIKKLVLACDAGRIKVTNATTGIHEVETFSGTDPKNFEQAGQEIIMGVDQFKVQLGVQGVESSASTAAAVDGNANYVTSKIYQQMAKKPVINSVKIGLIISGSTPLMRDSEDRDTFTLLGRSHRLKSDTTRDKLVRNTYESTIILRNARVMTRTP